MLRCRSFTEVPLSEFAAREIIGESLRLSANFSAMASWREVCTDASYLEWAAVWGVLSRLVAERGWLKGAAGGARYDR
jgi:hypothetical protein